MGFAALRTRWVRLNWATNRLFERLTSRPHHFELYKQLVGNAVGPATAVVRLGASSVWLGYLFEVPLEGKSVYAVEPDREALEKNPSPLKLVAGGEDIPLPSDSIGAIVCEYVVEHLEHPEAVLREAHRLLRPGGSCIFVTANLLSYSGIVTHLAPQRWHRCFLRSLRVLGSSSNVRPYPTAFRMNTLWAVRRLAVEADPRVRELHTGVDYPTYTYAFPVIHQLATIWHLILDRVEWLAPFRITLIGVLEKPMEASGARDVN